VVAGKGIGAALASPRRTSFRIVRSVVPLVCLAPTHMFVLNRGLGRHSSVVMVPLNAAAGLLANISSGFFLYGEAPEAPMHFLCGVGIILSGVLTLCMRQAAPIAPLPTALQRSISAAERGMLATDASPKSQSPILRTKEPKLEELTTDEKSVTRSVTRSWWDVSGVRHGLGRRASAPWAQERPKNV